MTQDNKKLNPKEEKVVELYKFYKKNFELPPKPKEETLEDKLRYPRGKDHGELQVKIESGTIQNPTIDTLSKIAQALDVKVDDLIKK